MKINISKSENVIHLSDILKVSTWNENKNDWYLLRLFA